MDKPKKERKKVSGMYDYGNIYTGPDSTSPGVLKAQSDKKKADLNLKAYSKKAQSDKNNGVLKAQSDKKKREEVLNKKKEKGKTASTGNIKDLVKKLTSKIKNKRYYKKSYEF
jgi:hypothetical protein